MSVPGIDVPDHRGRTGLDQVVATLTGNPDVVVRDVGCWPPAARAAADDVRAAPADGTWTTEQRETTTAATARRCCSTTRIGARSC